MSEGDNMGAVAATAAAAAAAYLIGGNGAFVGVEVEAVAFGIGGTGGTDESALLPNLGSSCFVLSIVLFRLGVFLDNIGLGGSSVDGPRAESLSLVDLDADAVFFGTSSLAGVFGAGKGISSVGSTREAESRD